MSNPNKEYLGDSVYASTWQDGIMLTTENGKPTDPSNTVFLDWETFKALLSFAQRHGVVTFEPPKQN